MKKYNVNIESPKCWNQLVYDHLDEINKVITMMRKLFGAYVTPVKIAYQTYKLSGGITMYEDELTEIAKILKISVVECLLVQLTYELCSACTSAILKVNNEYVHFRTMDWAMPELKAMTIQIAVYRGSKYLFDAITWAGCVGLFTGIKKKRYTIALNYRKNSSPSIISNILSAFKGYYPNSFCIRHLLESEADPSKFIKKVKLISPAYYTIMFYSKDKEEVDGHVIVRDRDRVLNIKYAPVVQTNCDNIYRGPNILYSFERVAFMNKYIDRNLSTEEFNEILNARFPVINQDTIYSCVMTLDGFSKINLHNI